jgi:hypothetical protein
MNDYLYVTSQILSEKLVGVTLLGSDNVSTERMGLWFKVLDGVQAGMGSEYHSG